MEREHHDLKYVLKDEWWIAAGMQGFKPKACCYEIDHSKYPNAQKIQIQDVEPLYKRADNPDAGILKEQPGKEIPERVTAILRGFRAGDKIPPVKITKAEHNSTFRYQLKDGCHRFYCSLAAGFTHIFAEMTERSDWIM